MFFAGPLATSRSAETLVSFGVRLARSNGDLEVTEANLAEPFFGGRTVAKKKRAAKKAPKKKAKKAKKKK